MEIADIHTIEVDESNPPYASGGKIERCRTSQTAGADDKGRAPLQFLLALSTKPGQKDMS